MCELGHVRCVIAMSLDLVFSFSFSVSFFLFGCSTQKYKM